MVGEPTAKPSRGFPCLIYELVWPMVQSRVHMWNDSISLPPHSLQPPTMPKPNPWHLSQRRHPQLVHRITVQKPKPCGGCLSPGSGVLSGLPHLEQLSPDQKSLRKNENQKMAREYNLTKYDGSIHKDISLKDLFIEANMEVNTEELKERMA